MGSVGVRAGVVGFVAPREYRTSPLEYFRIHGICHGATIGYPPSIRGLVGHLHPRQERLVQRFL